MPAAKIAKTIADEGCQRSGNPAVTVKARSAEETIAESVRVFARETWEWQRAQYGTSTRAFEANLASRTDREAICPQHAQSGGTTSRPAARRTA